MDSRLKALTGHQMETTEEGNQRQRLHIIYKGMKGKDLQ
jgi:hypothetical protein